MDVGKDYYAVLGLSSFATSKEIKHAFHRLARRYHPDSRETETPTSLFHQVQEAYAVLADPTSRRAYDHKRDEMRNNEDRAFACELLLSKQILHSVYDEQILYVLMEIAPGIRSKNDRLPLDLAIVIDRSTSMKGARLKNVKEAARQIIDQLQDDDILTIVSFNDRAEVVLSDRVGTSRAHARAGITALRAEGGTEILRGLRAGLQQVEARRREGVLSHLVLLTDGRTYGDDETCVAVAERAGKREIGISTMGIGEDWNDELLDEIAAQSGGTSAYIASPGQVRSLLQKKVQSLTSVYATGLRLTVRSADGVRLERAFRTSPSLDSLRISGGMIRLGALTVNSPAKVLFRVAVDKRQPGEHRLLEFQLDGDVLSLDQEAQTVKRLVRCRFVDREPDSGDDSVPPPVLSALSKITLYGMQKQAWAALAAGQPEQATRKLEMVATRLLDVGEQKLAQAAMLEAQHISERGSSTARGRKQIKYGTRSLNIGSEIDG